MLAGALMARVNTNFLPLEHRAFILDRKVMYVSIAVWIASGAVWFFVFAGHASKVRDLTRQKSEQEREKNAVLAERAATTFPQSQIQRLIDRFSFIKKAMGANDFPWLRFYQSLEDAMLSGEQGRRVSILTLKRAGERLWTIDGEAEDWKDATRFEEQMVASSYLGKKNFSEVRLLNYRAAEKGYRFTLQFNFEENL